MTPPLRPVPSISDDLRGTQQAMSMVAGSQVGYREGVANDNAYGDWYAMNNVAWCAQFQSWAAAAAGIPTSVIPKFAYTPSGQQWFASRGRLHTTPEAGDLGFVYYSSLGRIGHVFYIDSTYRTTQDVLIMRTIEGNTNDNGSSQGIGVFRLLRADTSNLSYGRPDYAIPVPPSGESGEHEPLPEEDDMPSIDEVKAAVREVLDEQKAYGKANYASTIGALTGGVEGNRNLLNQIVEAVNRPPADAELGEVVEITGGGGTEVLAFRGDQRSELYLFGFGSGLKHLDDDAVRVALQQAEVLRVVELPQAAMDKLVALSA